MTLLTPCLFGWLTLTLAPVPPEAPPDPLARGYLGITVSGGLTIGDVQAGMPAAKAGLKSGDVIVRVGTLHPQAFEQVVEQVCSYRPGSLIEIEVSRGGEKVVVKVKLGTRPDTLDGPRRVPLLPGQVLPDE